METKERLETVKDARDIIETAQRMVDAAVKGTRMESHYIAYRRYGLDQLLGNGDPRDPSLYNLLKELETEAEE